MNDNLKNETLSILRKYETKAKKKFGQNFLIDENVIDTIVESAEITDKDLIIEIGPGLGTLTKRLCKKAGQVVAIEIDREVINILETELAEYNNLKIVNEDVLKVDINRLIEEYSMGDNVKVVANLPYYITTPIVMMLLEGRYPIDEIEIMIQKEVAERFLATPSGREYGAITVAINYYSEIEHIIDVPSVSFLPAPKVDSAVVMLRVNKELPKVKDEKFLFNVVKGAFGKRRKTLVNSLGTAGIEGISKERVSEVLRELDIDENIRAEKISLKNFINIADRLK